MPSLAFVKSATPAVTAGAYSAGDIMGALIEFDLGCKGATLLLQEIMVKFKSAVTPSLTAIFFGTGPTNTTTTDNAAYSLNTADTFNVIATLPFTTLGAYLTDHGTPNTYELTGLARELRLSGSNSVLYMLLIDNTGVTLGSTSDVQISVRGMVLN